MKSNNGFSLLDFLITVTIAAILSTIGIPGFSHVLNNTQTKSTTHELYTAFQQARTIAVNRGESLIYCGSNDGESCEKEWNKFLLVFADENGDKVAQTEEVIFKSNLQLDATVITRVAFGLPYTVINQDGSVKYTGSTVYCPRNGKADYMQRLTWNQVGRPYLGVDTDKDGVIDTTGGDPLTAWCE